MDTDFAQRMDLAVAAFRQQVHHQAVQLDVTTPGVLLDWERKLSDALRTLGAEVMGAFLEAMHRDPTLVKACQHRARRSGHRPLGWRWTQVEDGFGGRHRLRTPYAVVDRRHQRGRRRKPGRRGPQGSGCYPVLQALGCRVNATPALLSDAARELAWGPSEQAALDRLATRGIRWTNSRLRRITYSLSKDGQRARTTALQKNQLPPGLEGESLVGKRVVICFDGGRVRTRSRSRGRRRGNGHRGYHGPWRTPRLLVIYTIDEKGRKPRQVLPIYDGVLTSADALFELLTSYLKALGVSDAQQVIFIADGAPEHWPRVTILRDALNLDPARVVEVFDWAHAVEHLTTVANAFPTWSDKRRTRWLKTQRSHLKQGHVQAVLQALQLLAKGRQTQTVERERTFFATHAHRMRYGAFRKKGIPLGSGAVESGLRRLVNLRMKGPGIFWTPEHAQDLFYLRCQLLSGRWEAFVRALLFPDQAIPQTSDHQATTSYVRQAA